MSTQTRQQPERASMSCAGQQSRHAVLLRIIRQLTDESNPNVLMRCLLDEATPHERLNAGACAAL